MISKEKLKELEKLIKKYKTIEVLNEKKSNGHFLTIIEADYKLNNGIVINREKYLKNGGAANSSIILPIDESNNLILVVQPRVVCNRTVGIEVPAGLIEKGETPLEATKREMLEETGYSSDNIIPLCENIYQDIASSEGTQNLYLALNSKKIQEQQLDETEHVSLFKCTLEEALDLVKLGYICDIMALYILERAKEYIKYN